MGLTKLRGRSVNRGIAAVQAEQAELAHARLMDEYVRLYRARQNEEIRRWKMEQVFDSPAASARLRFLERQAEARRKAAAA